MTIYFYNPNIHPKTEYDARLFELKKWVKLVWVDLIIAKYDYENWFDKTKWLEDVPEKGERCHICYEMRMRNTAIYAKNNDFNVFTTALSISPHKDLKKINEIWLSLSKELWIDFLVADFKKKNGFKNSCELSKKYKLLRQDYCWCVFSKKPLDLLAILSKML